MLLQPDTIRETWFQDAYALHFCSVSLGEFPMKDAHKEAIRYAREAGALVSFDPNIRLPLWDDHELLKKTVREFMPLADIVKISDEELEFITGKTSVEDAMDLLFAGNTKLVIYTKGSDGAEAYTKTAKGFDAGQKVKAVDTTGAGDAFIGSFLYQLYQSEIAVDDLGGLSEEYLDKMLHFSNCYCAESVQKAGVISSYPTGEEMIQIMLDK